jgi:hypothetical protein
MSRRMTTTLLFALATAASFPSHAVADVGPDAADFPCPEAARQTAVALNYCRASFHRIQRTPSKRVLIEEQEKILNNLNVREIADPEVVRLYTAVLTEIATVQIAERERQVIQETHRQAFARNLTTSALTGGLQVATLQHADAVQTGVRSWWDYRATVIEREVELWRVDKERMLAVVDKSSMFLDTFWKLAQKRDIPDRWLVRGADLDELAEAVREQRPEVRLRVLSRMERFMECFPPYYYYLARTQQELGRWTDAADTYRRLIASGDDHFRRDEMLAAAMCNLALIEDYQKLASAPDTARDALRQATDAWEVNLMCGVILARHGRPVDAEEAILRNLDVGLEEEQSRIALVSVYQSAGMTRELAMQLTAPETLGAIPAPLLLASAAALGRDEDTNLPTAVTSRLTTSLAGRFERRFGPDDFVIEAAPQWQLDKARLAVRVGDVVLTRPTVSVTSDGSVARFSRAAEVLDALGRMPTGTPVTLVLQYPDAAEMHVYLQELSPEAVEAVAGKQRTERGLVSLPLFAERTWRVTGVDREGSRTLLSTGSTDGFRAIPIAGVPPESKHHRVAKPIGHDGTPGTGPAPIQSTPFTRDEDDLPVIRAH